MRSFSTLFVPVALLLGITASARGQGTVPDPPRTILSTPTNVSQGEVVAPPVYLDQMYPESVIGPPNTAPGPMMLSPHGMPLQGPPGAGCGAGCCGESGGFGCTGGQCGNNGGAGCGAKTCGWPHRFWVRAEYIVWFADGMHIPPLVTTSTDSLPPIEEAGVLGVSETRVLYGNNDILKTWRSGARVTLGTWILEDQTFGIEWDIFGVGRKARRFSTDSFGNSGAVIARPFFNINPRDPDTGAFMPPAAEDAELVAYPGVIQGRVRVGADSEFGGTGFRFLYNLCCSQLSAPSGCGGCGGCGTGGGYGDGGCGYRNLSRVDFLVGYRHVLLRDRISITENLTTQDTVPVDFIVNDRFRTRNTFHGIDLGFQWSNEWDRWSAEVLTKVAFGTNRLKLGINGQTTSTVLGISESEAGGLLSAQSNLGSGSNNQFAVVPELGLTFGYRFSKRLRATVGYSFIYWSQVIRAGSEIDLDVNPDLIPPVVSTTGAPRPRRLFDDTDYWAQGFNFGLDARF